LNILRFIVDQAQNREAAATGPAARLKQLIDADSGHQFNLSELSGRCGYSSDHLRLLFQEQYHTSPLAYRQRQRQIRIMDLIINTDLPLKAIAEKSGFPHLTHFCTAFKKEFGLTPARAVKKHRLK
jgi:AraC-like DNA-binding protein